MGNEREQLQQIARAARRRGWDADAACFYAKRRFDQSGRDEDRLVWRGREVEVREAATALEAAEEALLRLPTRLHDRPDGHAVQRRPIPAAVTLSDRASFAAW